MCRSSKDLTDRQWRILEPLLPAPTGRGRPREWPHRQLIDGIRWRTRVGAPWCDVPWCDVPERYGHWQSIYSLFRRRQRQNVWALVWSTLPAWADAGGLIRWDVSVDSTINRAHQHVAGARRRPQEQAEPPGDEPADHGLGRSPPRLSQHGLALIQDEQSPGHRFGHRIRPITVTNRHRG